MEHVDGSSRPYRARPRQRTAVNGTPHRDMIIQVTGMHAVYRMYDATETLLYIGMTGHARRFDDHAVRRWFPAVAKITLEWHGAEASARSAELAAIRSEYPLYNITGNARLGRNAKTIAVTDIDTADILADALAVIGTARGLQWGTLAERLAGQFPERWKDANAEAASARYRAIGIRSVDIRCAAVVRKGCHRAAVEQAASARAVTAA